jgi:hypothetical protein
MLGCRVRGRPVDAESGPAKGRHNRRHFLPSRRVPSESPRGPSLVAVLCLRLSGIGLLPDEVIRSKERWFHLWFDPDRMGLCRGTGTTGTGTNIDSQHSATHRGLQRSPCRYFLYYAGRRVYSACHAPTQEHSCPGATQ